MPLHAGGQAVLLGLTASAVWGSADFSGGLASRRIPPAFVVTLAHGLSLAILLAAVLARHEALHSNQIVYGLLSGLAGGVGLIALYSALSLGSMGLTAALCGVLTTVCPVLVSWWRDGHPGGTKLAGFAVAALAIWLIAYTPGDKPHPRGLGLAVLAGLCFGAMLVLMRVAAAQGVLWALTWTRVASTVVGAVTGLAVFSRRKRSGGGFATPGRVLLLAALAGIFDTLGNLFYMLAAIAGRLDVAAVLSSLYPGATMLLAVWLLRERTSRSQAAGMVLALAAVGLIAV
jgi:drug/metabolite transporter (DMT)-like permease